MDDRAPLTAGSSRHASEIAVTEGVVREFSAFSGDSNPLHMDGAAARRLGFGRRVAHGAILLSEVSRVIGMELPGPGSLWLSSEIEFLAPVYVGEIVRLDFVVAHVSSALDVALVDFEARRKSDGRPVLVGSAKVKVLKEMQTMNYVPLESQNVIVSGGTRGLGRAITQALLEHGARVVALYRHDVESAMSLESQMNTTDRLATIRCDVTRSDHVSQLFDRIEQQDPPGVQAFVHAASPPLADIPLGDVDWATLQRFLETYCKGGLEVVQRCVPYFESAGCGRVVFIGSEATQAPKKHWAHYVTAKSAATGLVRALAVELAHIPATANVVSPGILHTSDVLPENVKAMTRNATPLKRLATEEEVAETVIFLLGKGGSFLNGATIPLTGGRVIFA
jgi:3-oxoacyl-[acyl-carrier protein] reductase